METWAEIRDHLSRAWPAWKPDAVQLGLMRETIGGASLARVQRATNRIRMRSTARVPTPAKYGNELSLLQRESEEQMQARRQMPSEGKRPNVPIARMRTELEQEPAKRCALRFRDDLARSSASVLAVALQSDEIVRWPDWFVSYAHGMIAQRLAEAASGPVAI